MQKFLIAVLTIAGLGLFGMEIAKADAASYAYYLKLAQDWENAASRLTGNERLRALELAKAYRDAAAREAPKPANPVVQPKPQPQPAPGLTQAQIRANAENSRLAAMRYLSSQRPGYYGGYLIWYSRPPIYQGETKYVPNPRPYFVNAYEAQREVTRLTNNGNMITGMSPY